MNRRYTLIIVAAFIASLVIGAKAMGKETPSEQAQLAQITGTFQLAPMNPDLAACFENPPKTSYGYVPPPVDLSHVRRRAGGLKDLEQLPSSFDWRDSGKVSPIKDQDGCGTCWDFGTTSVLESAVLMGENAEYNFSEQSVALCVDPSWIYYYDGDEDPCRAGGWSWLASESFIRKGAVLESCNPYTPSALKCDGACPRCDGCTPVKRVNGYRYVTGDQSATALIKQAVYDHGPTTMAFYYDHGHVYTGTGQYVYDYAGCEEDVGYANHLVSIVGWNDNIPHYETPGEGGWLVKNSWGTDWGNAGYFWLAYDSSCMTEIAYLTYEDYDPGVTLLHWDEAGFVGSVGYGDTSAWMANVFTSEQDSLLTGVDFWITDSNTEYEIYVYRDGDPFDGLENLATSQKGACTEAGYYSIRLDDPMPLYADQPFAIAAKMTTEVYTYPIPIEEATILPVPPTLSEVSDTLSEPDVSPPIQSGVSFVRHRDIDTWTDLADNGENACLRARTKTYVSFRYVETFGETEAAYFEDSTHLNYPYGVGIDGAGNLWVAEISGARAMKYTTDGSFVTSIGTAGLIGRADNTHFYGVADVAVDGAGNIWVVDSNPARVVKYDSGGNYLTQLGETWESGSDNDHFNQPRSVAFDSAGNIYVSDANNHRIQVFDSSGVYSAAIGVTGESGSDDAHFNTTRHIAIDSGDNLYVADAGNHRVQIFSGHNYVATIGVSGESGSDKDHFDWPMGVDVDANHIYVADLYNHRIQIFDRATRAYQNTIGTGSEGSGDNEFSWPSDVAVDSTGNIYVADQVNCRIQKFNSDLVYQRTFGTTGVPYLTDDYHYREPVDVAVDASGNIGIVEGEGGGNRFVKLNASGAPQLIIGEAGVEGTDNTHFEAPYGVAFDASGNIYVADTYNDRIQIFGSGGGYQATLGTGLGTGDYQFNEPHGIAVDNSGNIYVADSDNHRVQIYNSSRVYVATLGVTGETGSDNAHLQWPIDVYVDGNDDIYVADAGNHRVQKFNSSYVYQYTLGATGESGDDFGHFNEPSGVALDANGNIYVADRYNNRVQVFSNSGAYLTTIGGDWGSNVGRFCEPTGVDVDSAGNVYIADHHNQRIQKYAPGVPGWEQVNINGFGNRNNRGAWALETFNDALYVSTFNYVSGAEVYRFSSGYWERVVSDGFDDSTNVGVDWFTEFNGHLYAGTWNDNGSGSNGGQIWRSPTGDSGSWERVVNNGFGDAINGEIMTLAAFDSYLYAGTWSVDTGVHGAEIWRSSTGNSGSWTQVVNDTVFGNSGNVAIISVEVFNNHLYAATRNSGDTSGGEVWRTNNGTIWVQVSTDGFGDADNVHVVSLEVFNGALYAGTWNLGNGGEIWRTTNGTTWEQVVSDGLGNVDNRDIASLVDFDSYLYAIVGNFNTGPEVWHSPSGNSGSWKKVIDTGFGCGRASAVDWDNMTAVFEDSLYVGTFTWGNGGGRVWRLPAQESTKYIYLPLVLRKFPPNLKNLITKVTVILPQPLEAAAGSFCTWGGCSISPRLYHEPLADGRTLLGWTDLSDNGHVSVVSGDTVENTFDFSARSIRGLVAHDDGTFAVLSWNSASKVIWLSKRNGDGSEIWTTNLNKEGAFPEFWLGDGRLTYGNGLYAAYFTVKSDSGHYGDQFTYVDDNGNIQEGGWGWGCSHSLAELVNYHADLDQFVAVCSSDCYSSKGILINNSQRVYEADGNCGGNVSAQLGQLAPGENSWKLLFNALDKPCCEGRGIALATIDESYQSSYKWLTDTDGSYERDPIIAHLGSDGQAERYLVGWTTTSDNVYWLGVIDGEGNFLAGPEEVTSAGVLWGNRDDSFRTRADGSISWVQGDPASTELDLFRFDGAFYTP